MLTLIASIFFVLIVSIVALPALVSGVPVVRLILRPQWTRKASIARIRACYGPLSDVQIAIARWVVRYIPRQRAHIARVRARVVHAMVRAGWRPWAYLAGWLTIAIAIVSAGGDGLSMAGTTAIFRLPAKGRREAQSVTLEEAQEMSLFDGEVQAQCTGCGEWYTVEPDHDSRCYGEFPSLTMSGSQYRCNGRVTSPIVLIEQSGYACHVPDWVGPARAHHEEVQAEPLPPSRLQRAIQPESYWLQMAAVIQYNLQQEENLRAAKAEILNRQILLDLDGVQS